MLKILKTATKKGLSKLMTQFGKAGFRASIQRKLAVKKVPVSFVEDAQGKKLKNFRQTQMLFDGEM